MTARCSKNVDADTIARARRGDMSEGERASVLGHVESCEACTATARALERVKLAWADAAFEAPSVERARDLAAMRTFSLRAARGRRRAFGAGLGAGLAVAIAAVAVVSMKTDAPPPVSSASTLIPPAKWRGPIVRQACASCASKDGALTAGFMLASTDRVSVPRGAQLQLAFSLEDALEEPSSGVIVEGPATVAARAGAIALDQGTARVTTARAGAVQTPHLVANGGAARWSVESSAEGTRVDVLSGKVSLVTSSGTRIATVEAGQHLSVNREGHIELPLEMTPTVAEPHAKASAAVTASAAPPRIPASTRWATAQAALTRRDRASAEQEVRALLAEAPPTDPIVPRATFLLAELELAGGNASEARRRLTTLLTSSDAQLAEDAVTLLAQSQAEPEARARIWRSYAATNPPSPRRERALLEEARALDAAGDREGARRIAESLTGDSVPDDVRRTSQELLRRR